VLLLRMILMIDGMGRVLDPGFRLGVAMQPYVARLAAERMSPRAWFERAARTRSDLSDLAVDLPGRVRRLAAGIEADGIPISLHAAELEPLMTRLERIGDRLVGGMITASLIAGIGALTASGSNGTPWSRPLLHAGAGGVGVLGAYLLWTSRHHGPAAGERPA
jgi:ubiquinone biosynthesis protein